MYSVDVDAALEFAAGHFGARAEGERRYGWHRKSVGRKSWLRNGGAAWLRVHYVAANEMAKTRKTWDGELAASGIKEVNKPRIIDWYDWVAEGVSWRATVMSYIEDAVCSETPELREAGLILTDGRFVDLLESLAALRRHDTDRVACRQDLITQRVRERFGDRIDPMISHWNTIHGDVHWANVTQPRCVLLDWEVWGMGPAGLDVAFLLGFAGLRHNVELQIGQHCWKWRSTGDVIVARLVVCSELLRMIELHGDHLELERPLCRMANEALEELDGRR